ncbi:MAG TPA: hypothetical protein VEA69_21300 [Tepidisphaeraceae bacterium]|nr:hypothetical protein [Tepidisphaeraceae bacterium]
MNRIALAVLLTLAFLAVQLVPLASQEPGPKPREVRDANGEPVYDPLYWTYGHAYKVQVFVGERLVGRAGADTIDELREVLTLLAMRHAKPTPLRDEDAKPIQPPQVTFAIWSSMDGRWIKADGQWMPEGKAHQNVEVRVVVGSISW